jgi:hypothetical protein
MVASRPHRMRPGGSDGMNRRGAASGHFVPERRPEDRGRAILRPISSKLIAGAAPRT